MSKKVNSSEGSKRDNVKWTKDMDNVFIDAMLEQQTKGFRVDGTFTSTAYKNMLSICVERFGISLTKGHLKNRIKTLKSHFNICHELFKNKSGISWNCTSKIFEADNNVWDELITANPIVKKWRSTPVHNYDKLEELFLKDQIIGSLSGTCKEYMNIWSKESEEQAHDLLNEEVIGSIPTAQDPLNEDANAINPISSSTVPPFKSISEHSMSSKCNKRKLSSLTLQEVADTNGKLEELISCLKETNEFMYRQLPPDPAEKEYTKKEIFEELSRIGVSRRRLVRAYVTLGKSKENTLLFFSAPEDIRLEVLNELMNN